MVCLFLIVTVSLLVFNLHIMSENIDIVQPGLFAGTVADEIVACVQDAVADHGSCSIVLAGGRTPGAIYRMLAIPPRVDDIDWSNLRIYFSDERWAPRDSNQSNFRMVDETLLMRLANSKPEVFPINVDLPSPDEAAESYAEVIRQGEGLAEGQVPSFDIVILGVGTDGHTASIFPGSDVIHAKGTIAHAVPSSEDSFRVTLSPDALFSAKRILFIATGDHKADIMKAVLEGDEPPEKIPARLYTSVADRVTFFLASNAARTLTKK